jgi:PKD repeat protein
MVIVFNFKKIYSMMRKQLIIMFIALSMNMALTAQTSFNMCGTDEANRKAIEENPWLNEVNEQLERFTQAYIQQHANQSIGQNQRSRSGQVYIIPIVFHIVHNYGEEYLSDEQVYDALRMLNDDFRKRSSDTSSIAPAFREVAADCEIEFRMPTRDPRGNPTNGINRYQSMTTYSGSDDVMIQGWPRDMYMNVYVVNSFEQQGLLGYTRIPANLEGINGLRDGIVLLHNSLGSIGTGQSFINRTLTHEVGHWLNLLHTWGQTNEPGVACGDDGVFDTPITQGAFGCNLNQNVCTPGVIENVQNHMDYSGCPRMFTEGQKLRMQAALNSNVSGRNNLWSNYSLTYTGAGISDNTNTAPPVADFYIPNKTACIGEAITIKDFSWRGPITNWEWQFENATPSISKDKDPTVSFNASGWQKVTLKVTNNNGEDTKTQERFIFVREGNIQSFSESFEDADFVSANYIAENYANNESQWGLTDRASYTGGLSYMLNNFDVEIYDIDAFTTPEYDLSASFISDLKFKYSLATRASYPEDIKDRLRVLYSTDCGATWRVMLNQTGISLVTAGNFNQPFVPTQENQWAEISIPIPNLALNNGSAIFKFEFTRDKSSNNFYIDDINVEDTYTSVNNALAENININVFPNPSRGNFILAFDNSKAEIGIIQVYDMTGKLVFEENHSFSTGAQKYTVDTKFATGLYQLNLLLGKQSFQKKIQVIAE